MRVTVCELGNQRSELADQWQELAAHVRSSQSELVLLPEMPFSRWLAAEREVDPKAWQESVATHATWMERLGELGEVTVAATRPLIAGGVPFNQAFVWDPKNGARAAHSKHYLPDEEGFWEGSWYSRGEGEFSVLPACGSRLGFLICTEIWFLEHARDYGKRGVELIACPRATLGATVDKWIAGGRVAALVSGAFCLSSNFTGSAGSAGEWAGKGWIIEPEEGQILGTTSPAAPFLTLDLDLEVARVAKRTYPRYVPDL